MKRTVLRVSNTPLSLYQIVLKVLLFFLCHTYRSARFDQVKTRESVAASKFYLRLESPCRLQLCPKLVEQGKRPPSVCCQLTY
jgi:hypothetical protein